MSAGEIVGREPSSRAFEMLEWLYANCLVVLVECNQHRSYYDAIEKAEGLEGLEDAALRAEIVERKTLVVIQVYPDTPIGFFLVWHWDMQKAVELAYEAVRGSRVGRG